MVAAAVGIFLLGILSGFAVYRELSRHVARNLGMQGKCELCGTPAHVTSCRRCGRWVSMCCYFTVLGKDNPDPVKLRKRRSISVCARCLLPDEKEILERMVS